MIHDEKNPNIWKTEVELILIWTISWRYYWIAEVALQMSSKHYQAAEKQNRKMKNNHILSRQYLWVYLSLKFRPQFSSASLSVLSKLTPSLMPRSTQTTSRQLESLQLQKEKTWRETYALLSIRSSQVCLSLITLSDHDLGCWTRWRSWLLKPNSNFLPLIIDAYCHDHNWLFWS